MSKKQRIQTAEREAKTRSSPPSSFSLEILLFPMMIVAIFGLLVVTGQPNKNTEPMIVSTGEAMVEKSAPTKVAQTENVFSTQLPPLEIVDIQTIRDHSETLMENNMKELLPSQTSFEPEATVQEWTFAFNAGWQSGNIEQTYQYGGMLRNEADNGNPDALYVVTQLLMGFENSIYDKSVQNLGYDWLINAMHATNSLGGDADALFEFVLSHPDLEQNHGLYQALAAELGDTFIKIRHEATQEHMLEKPSAAALIPAPEINDTYVAEFNNESSGESMENPAGQIAESPDTSDSSDGGETQTPETQEQENTSNPENSGEGSEAELPPLAAPPVDPNDKILQISLSPATYVIMARNAVDLIKGNRTGSTFTLLDEQLVEVEFMGRVVETPFVLVTMEERRGEQVWEHQFLLVFEIENPPSIVEMFLDEGTLNTVDTVSEELSMSVGSFFTFDFLKRD